MVTHEWNAHQYNLCTRLVTLGDLMRDARERALDGVRVEDDAGFRQGGKPS